MVGTTQGPQERHHALVCDRAVCPLPWVPPQKPSSASRVMQVSAPGAKGLSIEQGVLGA